MKFRSLQIEIRIRKTKYLYKAPIFLKIGKNYFWAFDSIKQTSSIFGNYSLKMRKILKFVKLYQNDKIIFVLKCKL